MEPRLKQSEALLRALLPVVVAAANGRALEKAVRAVEERAPPGAGGGVLGGGTWLG